MSKATRFSVLMDKYWKVDIFTKLTQPHSCDYEPRCVGVVAKCVESVIIIIGDKYPHEEIINITYVGTIHAREPRDEDKNDGIHKSI